MFRWLTISTLCIVFFSINVQTDAQTSDRELMDQIVNKLESLIENGELERRELTFTVRNGQVSVTGRIEDAKESLLIIDAILDSDNLNGIQMNLGIGRHPLAVRELDVRPWFDADLWRRPLEWNDGHWELDFGQEPRGVRFMLRNQQIN